MFRSLPPQETYGVDGRISPPGNSLVGKGRSGTFEDPEEGVPNRVRRTDGSRVIEVLLILNDGSVRQTRDAQHGTVDYIRLRCVDTVPTIRFSKSTFSVPPP